LNFYVYLILVSATNLPSYIQVNQYSEQDAASSILMRHKRYNTGRLEEFVEGNLERECNEEKCSYEEAREIYENDEKTMEFWKLYIDGDQCISNPCLNGGSCKDDIGAYVCWCSLGYSGANCEIVLPLKCSVHNGGCQHLCQDDPIKKVICSCARGYQLAEDGRSCKPTVPYPCGMVSAPEVVSKHITRSMVDYIENNSTSIGHRNATKPYENAEDIVPVTEDPFTKIVGGADSLKGEFPWQVLLLNKNKVGFCGGSIVNEKWIVTAAHCFIEPVEFVVVAGEHNTAAEDGTEQYMNVAQIIPYPRYNATSSKYVNDIALVKLAMPMTFNDYVKPICIGTKNFTEELLRSRQFSVVTGWGELRYKGRQAIILQKLAVPYVNRDICKKTSRSIHRNMFCAGYSDQSGDSCRGDSGGPHATEYNKFWFLTGITSWGEKCAEKDKYGVYTKLSTFTSWVLAVTSHLE
uniref:Coagulation factor IX n=1 Tax=Leptobrachium leishanense TaxID=445787 RepID=A0A8C5PHL2_9ANUR